MAAFFGPVLIAGLLFAALCVQRYSSGLRTSTFPALSVPVWISAAIVISLELTFL